MDKISNFWEEERRRQLYGESQTERYRKMLKICNENISDELAVRSDDARLLGLMSMSIQLETSIAVLAKLENIE